MANTVEQTTSILNWDQCLWAKINDIYIKHGKVWQGDHHCL